MKAMGEFPVHILTKGIAAKTALAAEGKNEEEIATSIGETFKYSDNKLKYFMAALGVSEANQDKLYRVRVVSFAEGEKVPENAVQVEEAYYIPEFFQNNPGAKPVLVKAAPVKRGGKNDRKDKDKSSPWGLSPEEAAAKKATAAANKSK